MLTSESRATFALLARAARMIQNNADSLCQCHAPEGDCGADRQTQQIHAQEVSTSAALRALVRMPATPRRIPDGETLLHLARTAGLRESMHGVDATRAKSLLWKFLAATLAVMDESDVVDAELPVPAVEYADDLAVAERAFGPIGARRV
ncbi:hypothetical protein QYH69_32480 [Paraburkholderia sp. SARCC-3016]|uniref:hypothetical protein n=1 Tax=Paraburkholderia sp. SARCC-3016 TaxID=3058611 RepID=UPI0028074AE0|nr:hypothetical protein [Paraburkholderia sp. SARCC-3016]MDQ7981942.1 hypothetical protein [Paraburkholderia sp. SARCC-3016]